MYMSINPIGTIHSRFTDPRTGARQPPIDGRDGTIIVGEEYAEGLQGLEEFSHIFAIYYFHRQSEVCLTACPCFDQENEHGIFASRFPTRPNHIGISVLTLDRVDGNIVHCRDVDVLDGTPLLDIKPYVRQFDTKENPKCGWYDLIDWQKLQDNMVEQPVEIVTR